MASTYTDGLAIELIGSGDKAGSWGDVTNNNLQALEQGVRGFSTIALTGTATTINLPDGGTVSETTGDARIRSSVVKFTGAGGDHTVTLQVGSASGTNVKTSFIAINALDSTHSLIIDVGGTDATIPNGYAAHIHIDGTTVKNSFANLAIDKLAFKNAEIISNETDNEILIGADKVILGDGTGDVTLESNGNNNLVVQTGNSNTGSMTIVDGSNGDISITPHGTGKVVMDKVNIGGGEIDGTPIGANSASTGEFTTIESDTITSTNGTLGLSTTGGNKITLTANSSSIDFISASSGGVNTLSGENTKVVLNTASTNSAGNLLVGQGTGNATIKPGGTGRLDLTSSSTADTEGQEAIHIESSAGRIGLAVGNDEDFVSFRIPIGSAPTTPVFQGFFNQNGLALHNSGGQYLNFTSTTGSTGNGLRGDGTAAIEFRSRVTGVGTPDDWGRIYHSGMVSGDGAYFEAVLSATVPSSGQVRVAHSLSSVPRFFMLVLKLQSGETDDNFENLAEIPFGLSIDQGNGTRPSLVGYADSTYIGFHKHGTGAPYIINSSGSLTQLDASKWQIVARAWK